MIAAGTHTITVVSQPREWESKYGQMKSYTVKVEGDEGTYELSRKATSPAPTVGQRIDVAEVQPSPNGNYPPKLKLAQANRSGGGGRSPEESARIMRQHSQEMALRYAVAKAGPSGLSEDFKLENLLPLIEWFDKDAKAAKP